MTVTYLRKIFPMTWKRTYTIPTYQVSFDTSSQYITNTITPFNVEENTEALYVSTNPNAITIDSTDYAMQLSDDFIGISGWSANNIAMVSGTPVSIISTTEFEPTVVIVHKDTQGPCPNGFHIGTQAEWDTLKTALTTLGLWNKTDFMTYLKIPSAYYLNRSNGSKNTSYGPVRFWTSTMTSKSVSWCVGVDEKNAMLLSEDKPGNAFSIRPMKNVPAVPDNTWTLLTTGIYWSSTLGLISITGDGGTTYITISDKNLGATNVGDDGLYYQFGNNYGFSANPPSQSSTPVNTTGYGPGNYYNSSTFVTVAGKATNWMSADNNNIWGCVTNGTWTEQA